MRLKDLDCRLTLSCRRLQWGAFPARLTYRWNARRRRALRNLSGNQRLSGIEQNYRYANRYIGDTEIPIAPAGQPRTFKPRKQTLLSWAEDSFWCSEEEKSSGTHSQLTEVQKVIPRAMTGIQTSSKSFEHVLTAPICYQEKDLCVTSNDLRFVQMSIGVLQICCRDLGCLESSKCQSWWSK